MIVRMKRFSSLFIILFLLSALSLAALPSPDFPIAEANAQEELYAVAENPDVWFYREENEDTKLFCIPHTYYVKVISRGEKFTYCEYLKDNAPYRKIQGYCLTDSLTFVDFVPQRPYLFREVTVEYVLPGASLGEGKFNGLKETFVYYGTRYENGQLYFYVGKNGEFDYVPRDEELTFELNTDYLPRESAEEDAKKNGEGGISAVQIVLITLASVAVLVIAVFVALGKKTVPPENLES